jgi:hypothetical protein
MRAQKDLLSSGRLLRELVPVTCPWASEVSPVELLLARFPGGSELSGCPLLGDAALARAASSEWDEITVPVITLPSPSWR